MKPGTRFSHYEIVSPLGAGGMGEVYLAQDLTLDRHVAPKILPGLVANDSDRQQRFVREAKVASALNHPAIAHIHELGASDGVHFIAMEYVPGRPLSSLIASHAIDIPMLLDIAIQLADALDEARQKGITHRDIKPSNIMITARGEVKVLDFGLAKMTRGAQKPASSDETDTALSA